MQHGRISGMSVRRTFGYSLLVIEIFLLFFAFTQRQALYDWWRLRNYEPSSEVVELADNAGFNELGRKLFYVHDPQLLDSAAFTENCSFEEFTIVLGCHKSHTAIYIFDVDDPRLEGIEEVTAAHEMLHAAYDRLSKQERKDIDQKITQFYETRQLERLRKNIALYEKQDPGIVPNELHSIIGTEVRDLPDDIERYYARYFIDRSKVVSLAEEYENEFSSRDEKIKTLDARLEELYIEIEILRDELTTRNTQLTVERGALEAIRSDIPRYNSAVDAYNAKVVDYSEVADEARLQIELYNTIVRQREAIALEEQGLYQAIDASALPEVESN